MDRPTTNSGFRKFLKSRNLWHAPKIMETTAYWGMGRMVALVEAFGFRLAGIDEGTGFVKTRSSVCPSLTTDFVGRENDHDGGQPKRKR